jgi:hypothetical protein
LPTILKHIILFSFLFAYSFEGIIYGSYSINIILAPTLSAEDEKQESELPSNIRPIWTKSKHIKGGNTFITPHLVPRSLYDIYFRENQSPLFCYFFELIVKSYPSPIQGRAPPTV